MSRKNPTRCVGSRLAEPVRIRKHVDRDDLPALDRQGQDRKWTPVGRPGHAPGYPVQEDPRRRFGELTEEHRLLGNGLRAADQRDQTRTRHPAVGAPHDLRVGDGEQAFEVTGTRRHEEGVPMTR